MTPYPSSLPLDTIKSLIADIKSGSVGENRAQFGKAAWELSGFALYMALGEPNAIHAPITMASGPDLTDEEACAFLEQFTDQPEGMVAASVQTAAIPWVSILKWALKTLIGVL